MRSLDERRRALIREITDDTSTTRNVAMAELERLARAERAYVLAEFLADCIVWLIRLPRRIMQWAFAQPIRRRG